MKYIGEEYREYCDDKEIFCNEQSKLESFSQKGIDKFCFRKYNRLVPQKGG